MKLAEDANSRTDVPDGWCAAWFLQIMVHKVRTAPMGWSWFPAFSSQPMVEDQGSSA